MSQSPEPAGAISRPPMERAALVAMMLIALGTALSLLLAACNDTHPLYGPNTPRNGTGTPVDAIYGTTIPGAPEGNNGM
jgi:hypothetical protein